MVSVDVKPNVSFLIAKIRLEVHLAVSIVAVYARETVCFINLVRRSPAFIMEESLSQNERRRVGHGWRDRQLTGKHKYLVTSGRCLYVTRLVESPEPAQSISAHRSSARAEKRALLTTGIYHMFVFEKRAFFLSKSAHIFCW